METTNIIESVPIIPYPLTSKELVGNWLNLVTKLGDDLIYKPQTMIGMPEYVIKPPFITALYDLPLLMQAVKGEPSYSSLLRNIEFLIAHDIIDHIFCKQSTSTLSDATNIVAMAQVNPDEDYQYKLLDPFSSLNDDEKANYIFSFIHLSESGNSIYRSIINSFGHKYSKLTQYCQHYYKEMDLARKVAKKSGISDYDATFMVENKYSNLLKTNPELRQDFNKVLVDFRRWIIFRGAIKKIKMNSAVKIIRNYNISEQDFDPLKIYKCEKNLIKQIKSLYFKHEASIFYSYDNLNIHLEKDNDLNVLDKISNDSLNSSWDLLSDLILELFQKPEVEQTIRSFASSKNQAWYEQTRIDTKLEKKLKNYFY
jgi:hypothetical protein